MNSVAGRKTIFGFPPILILIFFFLPWFTFSCGNDLTTISGYELSVETIQAVSRGDELSSLVFFAPIIIGVTAVLTLLVVLFSNPLRRFLYVLLGLIMLGAYGWVFIEVNNMLQTSRNRGEEANINIEIGFWVVGAGIVLILVFGTVVASILKPKHAPYMAYGQYPPQGGYNPYPPQGQYPPQPQYPPQQQYPPQGQYPPQPQYPPQQQYPPQGQYPPQKQYPPQGGYPNQPKNPPPSDDDF
jgi:hypothetical protein